MKKIAFLFFIILLFAAAFLFSGRLVRRDKAPETDIAADRMGISPEFIDRKNHYTAMVGTLGPEETMLRLERDTRQDARTSTMCHLLAHEVGKAAFFKLRSFTLAIQFRSEVCNAGFTHGVIEAFFSTQNNLDDAVSTACKDMNPFGYKGWQCYHGIGHGIMVATGNDLPATLQTCGRFDQASKRACINGAFMENFNTQENLHPSRFLNKNDPFFPCETQSDADKNDCYVYAPTYYLTLFPGQYEQAFAWCTKAPASYVDHCVTGVGSQAMKDMPYTPGDVAALCMRSAFVDQCIGGMIGMHLNYFANPAKSRLVCDFFSDTQKEYCLSLVRDREAWLAR